MRAHEILGPWGAQVPARPSRGRAKSVREHSNSAIGMPLRCCCRSLPSSSASQLTCWRSMTSRPEWFRRSCCIWSRIAR